MVLKTIKRTRPAISASEKPLRADAGNATTMHDPFAKRTIPTVVQKARLSDV